MRKINVPSKDKRWERPYRNGYGDIELFYTWNEIEHFESKDENTFNAFSATIGNSLSKPQN